MAFQAAVMMMFYPWEREGDFGDTKYPYVCSRGAEWRFLTAISCAAAVQSMSHSFHAMNAAKAIIQSGIKRVVYECDKYADTDAVKASKRMFLSAGVELKQLDHDVRLNVEIIHHD